MADELPRLGNRSPNQGAGTCLMMLGPDRECGERALRHVLYVDGDEAWTTSVCHQHLPEARRVPSYREDHIWTRYRSACDKPYATWIVGPPGIGHCIEVRDEQDAELAELLQHDAGRDATLHPKPTDP